MADARDDLRATAGSIHHDAQAIQALEEEKAALDPADPRVDELAHRIEELTAQMSTKAAAETELASKVEQPGEGSEGPY